MLNAIVSTISSPCGAESCSLPQRMLGSNCTPRVMCAFVWTQLRRWERCQCALKFVAPGAPSVEEYLREEDEAGEQNIVFAQSEGVFSALCATCSTMHCCIQTILHNAVDSRKGIVHILVFSCYLFLLPDRGQVDSPHNLRDHLLMQ